MWLLVPRFWDACHHASGQGFTQKDAPSNIWWREALRGLGSFRLQTLMEAVWSGVGKNEDSSSLLSCLCSGHSTLTTSTTA